MPTFTGSTFSSYTGNWLVRTAVFELLFASLFLGLGWIIPGVRFGFILTAVLLGLVGVVLLVFGMRSKAKAADVERIEETGLSGTAAVISMTQTGVMLNYNPQIRMELMVTMPGRAPYQAEHTEFIPLMMLGRLGMGAPLAVKVDPADESKVVIEWDQAPAMGFPDGSAAGAGAGSGAWPGTAGAWPSGAHGWAAAFGAGTQGAAGTPGAVPGMVASSGVVGGSVGAPGGSESLGQISQALQASGAQAASPFAYAQQGGYSIAQLREHLRQNGLSGWATIDKLEDTGQTVGDDHLYAMQTMVHVDGQPAWQTPMSAAMVPVAAVSKVAVGTSIPVKVDPTNHDLLMFEWDKV